jgi:predicted ArsR family transcriptional regulator
MIPDQRMREVSQLLADDYSQKILVNTYSSPMSAQRLSKTCQIPIAACYRRIHELEQAGLLAVDREKEVYKGRKVRLYRCKLRSATIKFTNGRFAVRYDCTPEEVSAPEPPEMPQQNPGSIEPAQ